MPLIIEQHPLSRDSSQRFARVLSDQPEVAAALAEASAGTLLIEGIFNGQPVAILLAEVRPEGCTACALVVHPATRGRGVGTELLLKGSKLLPTPVEWSDQLRTLVEKHLAALEQKG